MKTILYIALIIVSFCYLSYISQDDEDKVGMYGAVYPCYPLQDSIPIKPIDTVKKYPMKKGDYKPDIWVDINQ